MGTAATRAKNKWQKENIDRINLTMPKGRKETIQAHAGARGESVNGFINRAIDQTMEQDGRESPSEATQGPSVVGVVSLPPDTLKAAQEAAQGVGETVSQFITRAVSVQAQRDKSSLALGINPTTGGKLEQEA